MLHPRCIPRRSLFENLIKLSAIGCYSSAEVKLRAETNVNSSSIARSRVRFALAAQAFSRSGLCRIHEFCTRRVGPLHTGKMQCLARQGVSCGAHQNALCKSAWRSRVMSVLRGPVSMCRAKPCGSLVLYPALQPRPSINGGATGSVNSPCQNGICSP